MHILNPKTPNEKPQQPASAALQVAIAVACALVVAQAVDWTTGAHVLLAVLTVFTSANRAALERQRCTRCGHRQ